MAKSKAGEIKSAEVWGGEENPKVDVEANHLLKQLDSW